MDNRGIDTDPGWVNRELRALRRKVEALTSERRASATTIGSGGLVVDGGLVVMLDVDGSEMFRLGPQIFADRGLTIARESGTVAFEMRKTFSNSATQSVYVRDDNGDVLLAEESLGNGLAQPYLPIPLQPVTATATALNTGPWGPEVVVNSATFTSTHQAWFARHNQYGLFRIRIAASDLTTAAEVRVINVATGNPLNAFFQPAWLGTRAAGSTGYTEVVTPGADGLLLPGLVHTEISVAVQVRRSAGAGTLSVAVPTSHGWTA